MAAPLLKLGVTVGNVAKSEVEVFIDFCCPFSKKIYDTLVGGGVIEKYKDTFGFTFHLVPQPWHAQAIYLHEAVAATKFIDSSKQIPLMSKIFEKQLEFYDDPCYNLTRPQIYEKVYSLGQEVGIMNKDLRGWLTPAPLQTADTFPANAETAVGAKLGDTVNPVFYAIRQIVKFHRKRGAHVTPTVFINGVEMGNVSSSWTPEQWSELLDPMQTRMASL